MSSVLRDPELPGLRHLHRGKVRDLFALPDGRLLMVASDRLSAFDVVLQDPIPGKGELLCQMSNFWFGKTAHIVRNHLTGIDVATVLPPGTDVDRYRQRSVVVQRLQPLPVEAIARGFIAGSGWKDYQVSGRICGIDLQPGLRLGERLPEPIFTPSSKAAAGAHDENIGFDALIALIGADLAEQVRATTLAIYRFALDFAAQRGILIADTKLEFGLDADGTLVLMDELLTPDSSRFWPADSWQPGSSPPSYDKQFVRDWLEAQHWDKTPPGPRLPPEIIEGTRARYAEALARLTA